MPATQSESDRQSEIKSFVMSSNEKTKQLIKQFSTYRIIKTKHKKKQQDKNVFNFIDLKQFLWNIRK